jgi:hypothetical protein
MKLLRRRTERGSLRVPAASGYHYTDDHSWSDKNQQDLIKVLDSIAHAPRKLASAKTAKSS